MLRVSDEVADLREARDELEYERFRRWQAYTDMAKRWDGWIPDEIKSTASPLLVAAAVDNLLWAIFDYERRVERGEEVE